LSKEAHRSTCIKNIPIVKQIIINNNISNITINETVLIEFRPLPHLEFLVRNTIIKLPSWIHTIVCGNVNHTFIKEMCKDLPVNIIRIDIDNLNPSQYSQLLLTKEFWENFKGDKILLYQEDSMLFHGNIEPFLQYDYIGGAWPVGQDDNALGVGNGGFSLRTRAKMLECIEKVNPSTDLQLGVSTLTYMHYTNSVFLPEDVFFSKSLIDHKLGKVAPREVANKFSQETQPCINPLGGHNFWLANNKKTFFTNLILENEYYKMVTHRGGWKTIITNLANKGIIQSDKNINSLKFVDCIESRFSAWSNCPKISIKENWIGIFHYSPNLPSFISYDLDSILNTNLVLHSLPYCKGLIVLSENNLAHIRKNPQYSAINIICLKHPIEEIATKFSLENFLQKKEYSVIQLGTQDRKITTIYTLKTKYNKIWLPGRDNALAILNQETKNLHIEIPTSDVDIKYFKNHDEYDSMLQNNIVIIPLWGASANNSVLETIEMNIPAFITRLPATEEYLGKEYPMFYTEDIEIEEIINNREKMDAKIKETHYYLTQLDKSKLRLDYFNSELFFYIFCKKTKGCYFTTIITIIHKTKEFV
jgi:hypothetical protein